MRITDSMMSNNFINSLNQTKSRIDKLSVQIATQSKIQKPSDSPGGTIKINRLSSQISQSETYSNNIQNGLSFIDNSIMAMERMQSETSQNITKLTELENATNGGDFTSYADAIDLSLKAIMDSANSQYDGKYIFGGTDYSTEPFGMTADDKAIEVKANDISGKHEIKIASNITQKLNMSGTEIFSTIVKGSGNLNKDAAVGDVTNKQTKVYDALGNEYTLDLTFTKTAANTYSLNYDILDGSSTSIYASAPAAKELVYDPTTTRIKSIDGSTTQQVNIKAADKKIDFMFNLSSVAEKSGATAMTLSANQKTDIFNTLLTIKENLKLGIKPTAEQRTTLENFNKHLLAKISEAGNVSNQFTDVQDQIGQQKMILLELVSKEKDVDVAKAIMEMQAEDNTLQMSYKMSAMMLPQSILNYL
ncbi:MAG: flagellar hook-associated protein FlgL [Ignavibacteriaceae bacterium]|jgi:flagellar hook-associated protein 3 FlgL